MSNPMKPAKDVHIDVILLLGEKPPFKLASKDITIGPDNYIIFDNDKDHDGFMLHYTIKDPNHGYYFPDSPITNYLKEALYSAKQKPCPSRQGQWGQFTAHCVKDGGRTLVVHNRNATGQEGQFAYTLRVTDNAGGSYLPLDPGGLNNNGYTKPNNSSVVAFAAVTALALVAVVALTETLHITNFFR
jgi:hypothetical protein